MIDLDPAVGECIVRLRTDLARMTAERDAAAQGVDDFVARVWRALHPDAHEGPANVDALVAEVARLRDDPALDATDGAHPAWWRGHDRAAEMLAAQRDAAIADARRWRERHDAIVTAVREREAAADARADAHERHCDALFSAESTPDDMSTAERTYLASAARDIAAHKALRALVEAP